MKTAKKLFALLLTLAVLLTATGTLFVNADPPPEPVDEEELLVEFLQIIGLDETPAEAMAAMILPYQIAELTQVYDAIDYYMTENDVNLEIDSVPVDTQMVYTFVVTALLSKDPDMMDLLSEAIVSDLRPEGMGMLEEVYEAITEAGGGEELEVMGQIICGLASAYCSAVTEPLYLDILDEYELDDDDFMREHYAEFIRAIYFFYFENLAVLNPSLIEEIETSLNTVMNLMGLSALISNEMMKNEVGVVGQTINAVNSIFSSCVGGGIGPIGGGGCSGGGSSGGGVIGGGGCIGIGGNGGSAHFTDPTDPTDPATVDNSKLSLTLNGENMTTWSFSSRKAQLNVNVSAANKATWEATPSESWLTVDVGGSLLKKNILVISAARNDTGLERTATVTVQTETESDTYGLRTITVTQGVNYDLNELFDQPADVYNHELATLAMELSYAVYNPPPSFYTIPYTSWITKYQHDIDEIWDWGTAYQFDDGVSYLDEFAQNGLTSSVGHVIAHKNITVDNVERPLIVVGIRGTAHLLGWVTNFHALALPANDDLGFNGAASMVGQNLKDYIDGRNLEDPIVLITGHSKGGSVSNVLAHKLNNDDIQGLELNDSDVYAYTFATVQVGSNLQTNYTNIFNILNKYDTFTYLPSSLPLWDWENHGLSGRKAMDSETSKNMRPSHEMYTYIQWMEMNPNTVWSDYDPA